MHHGVTAAFSLIPDGIRHGFSRQAIPCFFLGESVQRIHGAAKSVEASRAAICPGNNRRSVHFRTLRDNAGQHAAQARARAHTHHTHTYTSLTTFMQSGEDCRAREKGFLHLGLFTSSLLYRDGFLIACAATVIFHDKGRNNFRWYFIHFLYTPSTSVRSR